MYKKFPILFPDLHADFQLIKDSSDDPVSRHKKLISYFLNKSN